MTDARGLGGFVSHRILPTDLANGAICARVPDEPTHYLVPCYGMFWEEARASDLVKIGSAGKPCDPNAPWLNDGIQSLCIWVFGTRPECNFFVHGHEEEVMAVASTRDGIMPLTQAAVYLTGQGIGFI
jgi:ribulose-5-phosphate 4-epimerase/fuculose-1-phosphate aldolase